MIVDISALLTNIDIVIDIDNVILENIELKINFFSRFVILPCYFDEISISIVNISAFFKISTHFVKISILTKC